MARALLEIRRLGLIPVEGDATLSEGVSRLIEAFGASQRWIEEAKQNLAAALQQCGKIVEKMKALDGEERDLSTTSEVVEGKSGKSGKPGKPGENGVDGECAELVDSVKRMVLEAQSQ